MSIKEGNMENIRGLLKKRKASSHKGDYGRVGIIAGSIGMAGAVNLTSRAALRTGSGLVYSIVPESLELILSIKLTEAIIKPIGDKNIGYFTKDSLEQILKATKNMDALALGPGLGIDEERIYLVGELIKNINIPLVIDADGLNCLSKNINILKEVNYPIILTPHHGEMSRLLGRDIKNIESNRVKYAKEFSQKYNVFTVLKGHKTLVASPEGDIYINHTGNPGMATAGSGDVLTGIIVSLLGQGLKPFDSARLGVYLHGLAGDLAKEDKGEFGLIAGDILEKIPLGIMKYMEGC